ncbi:MAG: putative box helicase domain protein [Candidatus Taylorbacteria bacterium]|nr:putative box helicase domain protein [Candidatus Taylorbacteria bacterium]
MTPTPHAGTPRPRSTGGSSAGSSNSSWANRSGSNRGGFTGARSGGFGSRGSGPRSAAPSRSGSGGFVGSRSGVGYGGRSTGAAYGSRFGGRSGGRGGGKSERIDISRFIRKAPVSTAVTEEIPAYVPEHKFVDFLISDLIKQNITEKGYVTPTPIQDRAIPQVLLGRDVVGIANTGTGKTAAFLIPLIDKVLKFRILDQKENILIVVPTRELAIQIEEELVGFVKGMGIYSMVCVGGTSIVPQLKKLRSHHNFIIGTPGRLKDLIERKALKLEWFKTIVLDEADRMLDMGFIADMKFLVAGMPKPHHTLFFSATMSADVEKLVKDFLTDPVKISVKTGDTAANVDQDVIRVSDPSRKMNQLYDLLQKPEWSKVIVFGKTKHGVEKISVGLQKMGIKAESIHGDKRHAQRQAALKAFKENRVQVLVATDVAARGLDISNITHVVNYDIPATYDDYVHRIGRTGRGGKTGKAVTFV